MIDNDWLGHNYVVMSINGQDVLVDDTTGEACFLSPQGEQEAVERVNKARLRLLQILKEEQ